MTRVTSTQPHSNGRHAKPEPPPGAPSLPLEPDQARQPGEASLGDLVREATTHFSTLIRSEVELAKAEVLIALAILLFSLFFLFIALGEILAVWLPRWAAFSIVFGLMLLSAAGVAFIGWRRVRSIRKPKRTILAVRETGEVLTHLRPNHPHPDGQYEEQLPDFPEVADPVHGDDQRGEAQRADRQLG
jgi:hypothetical protein